MYDFWIGNTLYNRDDIRKLRFVVDGRAAAITITFKDGTIEAIHDEPEDVMALYMRWRKPRAT